MAITKIGAPLSGIRGTIGGITYSANKSGPYAKAWARASNPQTVKQTTERSYLSEMSQGWRDMNDAQRAAWDAFAALGAQELTNSLGEAYYASGWNWFCKCNIRLLRLARATIEAVPTQARPAAPEIDDFRVCVAGDESDLCVGGVATSSTDDGIHTPDMAFDDSVGAADRWQTSFGNNTGWLEYTFAAPLNIKRYRLYPYTLDHTNDPKSWTFEVWDTGAWHVIHTMTNHTFEDDEWSDWYCANPYTSDEYRIDITANNGAANALMVVEMEMYAGDEGSSVVCYPLDQFYAVTPFDLVLHVSMGQTIGKLVQYPGYYETLVNKDPGRTHQLFQEELESVFGTIAMEKSWFCRFYRQTQEGIRCAAATERTVTIEGA